MRTRSLKPSSLTSSLTPEVEEFLTSIVYLVIILNTGFSKAVTVGKCIVCWLICIANQLFLWPTHMAAKQEPSVRPKQRADDEGVDDMLLYHWSYSVHSLPEHIHHQLREDHREKIRQCYPELADSSNSAKVRQWVSGLPGYEYYRRPEIRGQRLEGMQLMRDCFNDKPDRCQPLNACHDMSGLDTNDRSDSHQSISDDANIANIADTSDVSADSGEVHSIGTTDQQMSVSMVCSETNETSDGDHMSYAIIDVTPEDIIEEYFQSIASDNDQSDSESECTAVTDISGNTEDVIDLSVSMATSEATGQAIEIPIECSLADKQMPFVTIGITSEELDVTEDDESITSDHEIEDDCVLQVSEEEDYDIYTDFEEEDNGIAFGDQSDSQSDFECALESSDETEPDLNEEGMEGEEALNITIEDLSDSDCALDVSDLSDSDVDYHSVYNSDNDQTDSEQESEENDNLSLGSPGLAEQVVEQEVKQEVIVVDTPPQPKTDVVATKIRSQERRAKHRPQRRQKRYRVVRIDPNCWRLMGSIVLMTATSLAISSLLPSSPKVTTD